MSQRVFDRLEATGKLPTPPGVVLQLLELTRRNDVSAREIADTLGQDPALAAKILRFANSPMAGVSREVTSLQHAVALMGTRGVKMTALSFAVLGSSEARHCNGFNEEQFAVQSIGCGVAAKLLAEEIGVGSGQEAFMAGLLSQLGRAVLAIGVPTEYAEVLAKAQQIPRDLPPLEIASLGDAYPTVSSQLLRSWNIPEGLCIAIERMLQSDDHEADPQTGSPVPPLAKVLQAAEVASGIICPDVKGEQPTPEGFLQAAKTLLGIDSDRCAELMSAIASEIENTRTTLEMSEGKMRSPEDIQNEVRERIAEISLAMHIENQTMAEQKEDLMRRATTDALTGVGNRVAFDARLSLELERAARSGAPFALLMMDVDRFKTFNDTYGHQAGDRVLQTVARVLDSNIRKVDYVARYGGEEFAVVAPEATVEGVSVLAERLRRTVEETSVAWEGEKLSVTISIGAAVYTDIVDESDAADIIKCADTQLYAAKGAGRNRVCTVVNGKPLSEVVGASAS